MNRDFESSGPDAALTDEERALAARLARTAPQRGPSAELDARILAAARAAASTPKAVASPTRRLRRRRWPVVTGVAATLMLAVGLAWQLRPVDELRLEASEAPRASRPAGSRGGPSADDESAGVADRTQLTRQHAFAAAESKAEAGAGDDRAQAISMPPLPEAKQPTAPASPEAPKPLAPAPESAAADMRATQAIAVPAAPAQAAPPPPPPSAPSPPSPAPVAASKEIESAAATAVGTSTADGGVPGHVADAAAPADHYENAKAAPSELRRQAKGAPASKPAEALRDDNMQDRIDVTSARASGFEDQPLDDEPPASADSPVVREAWLQRVRDLLTRGDRAAALDSLREYQRRHPDAPIPEDLRPLLSE